MQTERRRFDPDRFDTAIIINSQLIGFLYFLEFYSFIKSFYCKKQIH
jgi:hypothetical protein